MAPRAQLMTDPTPIPLSDEAASLIALLRPRIQGRLKEVDRTPVSVLIWGPGLESTHALATVRGDLRRKLRENGHAAFFSEELCEPRSDVPVRLQQLAQAQEFDLIVSLPGTPGSVGEIHDFACDRRVHAKILVFLNRQHVAGYSAQSLATLQTVVSCQIEYYDGDTDSSRIVDVSCDNVQRIREMKYIMAGRF